ncbi:hypothetical protein [Arenibaculum pallidiluteum]|uniref:hypothetical protein n=1 Tax=Arenibaculum pallidiluteum TaxID=2812559 RepID=UPI001A968A86|nr:hypothetical protein [Arenibaculum pallidiluteum]
MRILTTLAAAVTAWLTPTPAPAHQVQVGPVVLDLPVPKGLCVADRGKPEEALIFNAMQEANVDGQLLLLAFDCEELEAARAGAPGGISSVATWSVQVPEQSGSSGVPELTRRDHMRALVRGAPWKTFDEAVTEARRRLGKPKGDLTSVEVLGDLGQGAVLFQNDDMMILATARQGESEGPTSSILGGTVLRSHPVTFSISVSTDALGVYSVLRPLVQETLKDAIRLNAAPLRDQ